MIPLTGTRNRGSSLTLCREFWKLLRKWHYSYPQSLAWHSQWLGCCNLSLQRQQSLGVQAGPPKDVSCHCSAHAGGGIRGKPRPELPQQTSSEGSDHILWSCTHEYSFSTEESLPEPSNRFDSRHCPREKEKKCPPTASQ